MAERPASAPAPASGAVSYPNFADKHAGRPVMTAADMLAWRRGVGHVPSDADQRPPEAAILTYQPSLLRSVVAEEACVRFPVEGSVGQIHLLERTGGKVALVGGFGFGAPVAAIVFENLVALGVDRFVSMGTAGGLQPGQAFGDVVLCTATVRDEGVSHHYVPPARWAHPTPALTERLGAELAAGGVAATRGTAWTIDTPYMETDGEVRHYRGEGVACVEMEAAALFSVARRRGVAIASAFALSDEVTPDSWVPGFAAPELAASLRAIFEASVRCLEEPGG